MLGAGGTGGYVAPYVFRLLHMLDRPARFVVCDGDIVEPKNLDRQNFVPADLGENKARVLAERYSTVLGMETEYVPSFIEKLPDLMELIEPKEWELNPYSTKRTKEMVLLLGCVDNNKTRQLCHQAFHQSEELIYIDSGNGKYTGQVVCGVRRNGRTIRKSIGGVHPEMQDVLGFSENKEHIIARSRELCRKPCFEICCRQCAAPILNPETDLLQNGYCALFEDFTDFAHCMGKLFCVNYCTTHAARLLVFFSSTVCIRIVRVEKSVCMALFSPCVRML